MPVRGVEVRGLKDLQRELRKVDKDLPKELADANQEVAQIVVRKAKARANVLGGVWKKAADSLAAARQQRVASVRIGGARYPYALGAEFGAYQNMLRMTSRGPVLGWNQFGPWRGNQHRGVPGYFLYPTIREEGDNIVDLYHELLGRLLEKAFPD